MGHHTLSEDGSSTYCSRVSEMETPKSPTSPSRPLGEAGRISPVMVLPSLVPSPHSTAFHDVSHDRVEGTKVEGMFESISDSTVISAAKTFSNEFVASGRKREQLSASETKTADAGKTVYGVASVSPTSVEAENHQVKPKSTIDNISSVVGVDDDDRTSSIKFTFVEGESLLSRSPTATSIAFEVEPSSNMRGTSVSSVPTPNNSKFSGDTADGKSPRSSRLVATINSAPTSSALANEMYRAGIKAAARRPSLKGCALESEVLRAPGVTTGRCSSTSSVETNRGQSRRSLPRKLRSRSGSGTPLGAVAGGTCSGHGLEGSSRGCGSQRSERRGSRGGGSDSCRGGASGRQPKYRYNEPPSYGMRGRRSSAPARSTPHAQRTGYPLTSPRISDALQQVARQTNCIGTPATSPALELFKQHYRSCSPMRVRQKRRKEILTKIERELTSVRDEMKFVDTEMEQAMLSDPHVRLYHMNNRRDRDERRSRLLLYLNLENARNQLLSEDDEAEEQRLKQQREKERKRGEMFDRLHQQNSVRRNGSQGSTPRRRRTPSSSVDDGLHERLYSDAVRMREWQEERRQRAKEERENAELEELLYSRVRSRVGLDNFERKLTPGEEDERAAVVCTKLLCDPAKLQDYFRSKRLSREEEEHLNARLSGRSESNLNAMRRRKEAALMAECTFKPRINSSYSREREEAFMSITRPTAASKGKRRETSDGGSSTRHSSRRPRSVPRNVACERLYKGAKIVEDRRSSLRVSSESMKKLQLLKSKLKEDHHFRRRAELDPSVAQRYMDSLVV